MRPRRAQAGLLLLPVVLLLALVAAIAFMLERSTPMVASLAGSARDLDAARYVAEAGLAHAVWKADHNACTGYALASTAFGTASYSAVFNPASGSPVDVSATGVLADGATRTLTRQGVTVYQTSGSLTVQPDATTSADTYLNATQATRNYGAVNQLQVTYGTTRTLLRFDLSAIPADSSVISATLTLHQQNTGVAGSTDRIDLYRVTTPWVTGTDTGSGGVTPSGATWATSDGATAWTTAGGDVAATRSATMTTVSGGGYKSWDVTDLAAGWVDGTWSNDGMELIGTSGVKNIDFDSSESTTAAQRPALVITYGCECGGNRKTMTAVIDASGSDTYIDEASPAANNGAGTSLLLSSTTGTRQRALLRFDLSSIPIAATVTSAVLSVDVQSVAAGTAGTITAYPVTRTWEEGDGTTMMGACYLGASWNDFNGCAAWTTPGGDYDATTAGSTTVNASAPGRVQIDVTAAASAWHAGTAPNDGLLLVAGAPLDGVSIASGEAADASLHPQLVVSYTCACGADCVTTAPPEKYYEDPFPVACSAVGAGNGSTGSEDWTPWAWAEVNDDGNYCSGNVQIVPDGAGYSLSLAGDNHAAQRDLDLSGFGAAYLSLDYRLVQMAAGNGLHMYVSTDAGANWDELAPIEGPGDSSTYATAMWDISGFRSADTRIALLSEDPSTGSGNANQILVDNVRISDRDPGVDPTSPISYLARSDAWIDASGPSNNHASSTTLPLISAGTDRDVIRFDVSPIAAGSPLQSAVLQVYVLSNGGTTGTVEAHALTEGWTESGVTWTSRDGSTAWTDAGGTYDATAAGSATITSASGYWLNMDITALAQSWVDGSVPNDGVVLLGSGLTQDLAFASREAGVTYAPRLVVRLQP